jgi:hypothetical protein
MHAWKNKQQQQKQQLHLLFIVVHANIMHVCPDVHLIFLGSGATTSFGTAPGFASLGRQTVTRSDRRQYVREERSVRFGEHTMGAIAEAGFAHPSIRYLR